MNAEQVVDKILAEARAEADAIKAESDRRCAEMKAELQKELDAYRSETNRLASEAASDKQSRMLASAKMAVRKDILAAKRALLDGVQEEAARRIAAMPDEEYQKLMTALMMKAAETGDEEVVIGKNESRITEKLIKEVNRQLGPGYRGNLHLARSCGHQRRIHPPQGPGADQRQHRGPHPTGPRRTGDGTDQRAVRRMTGLNV